MINPKSELSIQAAAQLSAIGLVVECVHVKTPDGRTWEVMAVPAGYGRKRDHSWGEIPGTLAGFRLFEIDLECRRGPDEHQALDNRDRWYLGDLRDYLAAVGVAPSFSKKCSCPPTQEKAAKSGRICGWLICSRCDGRIG